MLKCNIDVVSIATPNIIFHPEIEAWTQKWLWGKKKFHCSNKCFYLLCGKFLAPARWFVIWEKSIKEKLLISTKTKMGLLFLVSFHPIKVKASLGNLGRIPNYVGQQQLQKFTPDEHLGDFPSIVGLKFVSKTPSWDMNPWSTVVQSYISDVIQR